MMYAHLYFSHIDATNDMLNNWTLQYALKWPNSSFYCEGKQPTLPFYMGALYWLGYFVWINLIVISRSFVSYSIKGLPELILYYRFLIVIITSSDIIELFVKEIVRNQILYPNNSNHLFIGCIYFDVYHRFIILFETFKFLST